MKRTLLFTMCLLASVMMSAQSSSTDNFNYVPFVKANKIWHVFCPSKDRSYHYRQFELTNEEEVKDGKTYIKMNLNEDGKFVIYGACLLREENRKVYIYSSDKQKEILLFDYSLKEGDTYEVYSIDPGGKDSFKVLSVDDFQEGPEIAGNDYDQEANGTVVQHRYLRKWTVCRTDDNSCQKTWIEGIGSLKGPFENAYLVSPSEYDDLSYVSFVGEEAFSNPYLPISFHNDYYQVHGCNLPTGGPYPHTEDSHHQLSYVLEGDRLHVYGKVFVQCGPNNYAYFFEKPTDDPLVRKIHFKIEELEPIADCMNLRSTDFYVSGFDPNISYIVVDNQGVEHPVINKNLQPTYHPLVEEGKVWKVGGIGANPVQIVDYYYFDGDTIINGKACKQMMRQRFVSPEHPNYDYILQEPSLSYVGAWYEEDKKVYTYDTTYHQFTLMYDFSLEDNGTFQTNGLSYVIGSRQSGGIKGFKGVHRSVRLTADGESIYSTPWLEGVGGLDRPTTNVYPGYVDPAWFLMACVVGDEVIYLDDGYEDGATPEEMNARKQRIDFTHIIKTQPKTRMRQQAGDAEASETSPLYGEYNERLLDINLDPLNEAYLVLDGMQKSASSTSRAAA